MAQWSCYRSDKGGGVADGQASVKRRICLVTATPLTLHAFMRNHMRRLAERYEVTAVSDFESNEHLRDQFPGVRLVHVPIVRPISPFADLRALVALLRLFFGERFDVVHSVTPKAGLLAMLAAWVAGVPRRVHSFTGQVWVTKQGWRRGLLKLVDRLLAALTTRALIDSPSQREFLLREGVLPAAKAEVIGKGSICGVDAVRFQPDAHARHEVRESFGIAQGALMLLFLGRLNRDKGVCDLAAAFALVASRLPDAWLVLVGPDEEGLASRVAETCGDAAARVRHVDFTRQPERFMAAADIFCLPSYREGFGQVLVEAAAAGLPVVASRIYGITDAVVEGETGLLHPPGDIAAIEAALSQLICDAPRRAAMGDQARRRVLAEFSQADSTQGLMAFYGKMLI